MLENITNFNFKELNKYNKIFVLVSGGIDSTYLFELIKQECQIEKVYAVNCYNPYENNNTLKKISEYERFIQIIPADGIDYKEILIDSFKNVDRALDLKKEGKYHKKIFHCCKWIKHDAFKKDKTFCEPNTVVVSGIKYSDGTQRRLWLQSLRTGITTSKGTKIIDAPTFYHKHKEGQNYCYPFRDYGFENKVDYMSKSEYPQTILNKLREIYPDLNHSGCYLCPVLVVFAKKILKNKKSTEKDKERTRRSIDYYIKINNKLELTDYTEMLKWK